MPIANPAYLKYPYQGLSAWQFNVFPKTVVGTATLSGTPTNTAYPRGHLTVTGASGGWTSALPDMLVEIARAGVVYYRGSVRKVPTSTTLYIAGAQYGDTGQAQETATTFANGDTVTIYSVRIPWAFWSRIDFETEFVLKRWDETVYYDDAPTVSKTAYPLPVANLGAWQRGAVDATTGVATLTHSAAASTVWRGSGFTVLWSLPSGAALAGGYALTDEEIEVEYDPGIYIIACTITEVGGSTPARTRTAYRYVWAIDNETVFDTSEQYAIEPLSSSHLYNEGRVMTFRMTGADLEDVLYTGAPVLMTYQYKYSDDGWETTVTVPEALHTFVGYISNYTTVRSDGEIDYVEITVENPLSTLRRLGIAKQLLAVKAAQNRWFKTAAALGHIGYFTYYLIDHHASWVLSLHDFDYTALEAFFRRSFTADGGDSLSALQRAASFCLGGTIGCTTGGKITLKREPQIEGDTYNSTLDEYWTIDGDLVEGEVVFGRSPMMGVYDARGGFTVTGTTRPIEAYIGRTNAAAPSQGVRLESIPDHIALTRTDGLQRTGNFKAAVNAPTPDITIRFPAAQDVIDPCQPRLYRVDMPTLDALNTSLLDDRLFVARRIDQQWQVTDVGETIVKTTAVLAPVTRGQAGLVELQPGVNMNNGSIPVVNVFPALNLFETATDDAGVYVPVWDWGWQFDFGTSAMGFTGDYVFVSGQGLRSDLFTNTPTVKRRFVDAELSTGAGTLTDVRRYELEYTATQGANYQPVNIYTYIDNTTPPSLAQNPINGTETIVLNAPSGSAGDGVDLNCLIGNNTGVGATDPGGEITLNTLTAYGVNVKPTGWTNGASVTPPADPYWDGTNVTLDSGNQRRLIDILQYSAFPYPEIVSITVIFDLTLGTYTGNGDKYALQFRHVKSDGSETGITQLTFDQADGTYEGTDVEFTWTGRLVLQGFRVRLSSSFVSSSGTPDGTCRIKNIYYGVVDVP